MGVRCSDYYQITMRNATLQSQVFQSFTNFQTIQAKYFFYCGINANIICSVFTKSCGAVMEFSCKLKKMDFNFFQIRWPCPGTLFLGSLGSNM